MEASSPPISAESPHPVIFPPTARFLRRHVYSHYRVSVLATTLRPISLDWHRHDQMQVLLTPPDADCEAGWRMEGEDMWQKLPSNHVWIIPPGTPHALNWKRESPLVVLYLEMDHAEKTVTVSKDKILIESLRRHELVEPLIGALGHRLRQFCHLTPEANERDHAAVLGTALAHELLASHGKSVRRGRGHWLMDSSTLLRLKTYIEENLAEELSPALLARVAAMSRSCFFEAFKEQTGLTPRDYVNRLRVLHARDLLQTGHYTVADAAYASGFCDQSGIDRHFRKILNATPRSFIPLKTD